MRIRFWALVLGLALLSSGCDSPGTPVAVTTVSAPHRGTMIRLPEDKGFVELVNEPEVSDRRKPEPTSIVAYYLKIDGKSPLDPAPADVTFAIAAGGGKGLRGSPDSGERITLSAAPRADDPQGAGRFASKPGPYDLAALRGTLTAKIGGEEVASLFGGGR
jgi:hypothetical protein